MSVKIYQKLRLFKKRFLPNRLPQALGYAVALFQISDTPRSQAVYVD